MSYNLIVHMKPFHQELCKAHPSAQLLCVLDEVSYLVTNELIKDLCDCSLLKSSNKRKKYFFFASANEFDFLLSGNGNNEIKYMSILL